MAASVCVCDNFVLVHNKDSFGTVSFSCPDKVQKVTVPYLHVRGQPPPKKTKQKAEPEKEENFILTATISPCQSYVAVCDDRKYLHIYRQVEGAWHNTSSRSVSKRGTSITFTGDSQTVLVSDKAGDVFALPLIPSQDQGHDAKGQATDVNTGGSQMDTDIKESETTAGNDATDKKESDGQKEEDNEDGEESSPGMELKLGHLSMILKMMMIEKDSIVVTCDRDEKIRLSSYPDSYNIHAYCLGHTAFVNSLAYDAKQQVIISGSGDCTVRLWTVQGKQLCCHNVLDDMSKEEDDQPLQEAGDAAKDKDDIPDIRPSIRGLAFHQPTGLVVVSLFRSPVILVYKVTPSLKSGVSLTLKHRVGGEGHVTSLCVQGSMLWVLRQGDTNRLSMEVHKLGTQTLVQIPANMSEGSLPEAKILNLLNAETTFFTATEEKGDANEHLWKTPVDKYVDEYKERKRQRMEGKEDAERSRYGKNKKKS